MGIIRRKKPCSIDNVIIDNSEKIANEFHNFFVSIGHKLAKDITCDVNPLFYVNSVNDSIVVQHVSVAQKRNLSHPSRTLVPDGITRLHL